jgi:hypothetical protein
VLRLLVSVGFQFFSLPSKGCFSSTCSRRLFAIGRQRVLSLGRWSSLLHAGFHVSDATRGSICPHGGLFRYRALTFCGRAFQSRSRKAAVRIGRWPLNPARTRKHGRFGLIPVRSPLLRESRLLSIPGVTEMFHFAPFASEPYNPPEGGPSDADDAASAAPGCPIRRSRDLCLFGGSSGLIAAYHVLHRLLAPRHPPYTLVSLTLDSAVLGARGDSHH